MHTISEEEWSFPKGSKLFPFQQGLGASSCETHQQSLQYGGCSQQYKQREAGEIPTEKYPNFPILREKAIYERDCKIEDR